MDASGATRVLETFKSIDTVLNIFELGETGRDEALTKLIEKREKARQAGEWQQADDIRRELLLRGIVVQDGKIGSADSAGRRD